MEPPLPSTETTQLPGFLSRGGEMGERIRAFDWSATSLGSVHKWPQSLRSAVSICLNSNFPIAIYWGKDLVLLYNDAWSPKVIYTKKFSAYVLVLLAIFLTLFAIDWSVFHFLFRRGSYSVKNSWWRNISFQQ